MDEQKWTESGPIETARRDFESLRLRALRVTPVFWAGITRFVKLASSVGSLPLFTAMIGLFWRFAGFWRDFRS